MINETPIFQIRNLNCTYPQQKNGVVWIDNLDIPRGKLIVILGKSGSGKSTILETLGLMNQTMQVGSSILFSPDREEEKYEYGEVWTAKTQKAIDHIRKEHFSFIFQSTNLMPNFTAYENVIMSLLIQGKSQEESMLLAHQVMDKVGMNEVDVRKKTFELSGGQKQRLAFVRAIIRDFTVLFGDEPTGNLDEVNSRELMAMLKENIQKGNRSAILVSHNIDLTVEFADQILVLTKEKGFGEFLPGNTFFKSSLSGSDRWFDSGKDEIKDIHLKVRSLI